MDHDANFGVQLALAYQQMVAELHTHLAAAGFADVRQTFGYAFKILAREELTTSQLAARLGVTHQGAAKAVDEMVAAGYVDRVPDADDRRTKRLILTARAHALLAAGDAFHKEFERELADQLGPDAVAACRTLFTAVIARSPEANGQ